ncbi:DUF1127 domain-containing protein [Pararhodobacter marinus]|uniref:YjiS-like domain-containing protein n=1 Tax=Pararhodobacter marinus TaxID=2184063 RepID=A0A2U2CA26_9RHOB|nr:DUF1127 domain-containing protein [Pararhodobacter marinus]PWE28736.1 hypothetical protein C4N9_10925 [Pararhodobacter marinus]
MTCVDSHLQATLPAKAAPSRLARLFRTVLEARSLVRQRVALGALDDRLLKDIGLDRSTARAEADRPFWDGPDWWR